LLFDIGSAAERLRRDDEAMRAYQQYLDTLPNAPNREYVESRIVFLREQLGAAYRARQTATESSPVTESTTVIESSEATPAGGVELRVRIAGGSQSDESYFEGSQATNAIEWPARATIIPRDGDASRPVRIDVDVLVDGAPIASAHVSTGFVAGETRVLHLVLS